MTRMYKVLLCFYITHIVNHNVHCDPDYCNQNFDPITCAFDVECEQLTLYGNMWDYQYGSHSEIERNYGINSNTCGFINVNGYNLYPIHLRYKINGLHYLPSSEDNSIPPPNSNMINIITTLDISNNNYESIPNLGRLTNLAILKLCFNALSVAKLSNNNELPLLTEIDLSHNNINDIEYESSPHIYRTLKKIDLSYNSLTKIPEEVFDPFDDLITLDISHNYIDTLSPTTFEGTKNLLHLNISYNSITDINSSLFRFNELKQLDLSYNKIKSIKANDFRRLKNLEKLDLQFNFISVIEEGSFHIMHLLNTLYLNNNKLENMAIETFYNVSHLVDIDISGNKFKVLPTGLFKNNDIRNFSIKDNSLEGSVIKGAFEGLSSVTKLDLSNQHLDSADDYAFHGLNNIIVLLLNENNIRSLSSKCFRTIHTLKRLDLSFNKIDNIDFEKDDLLSLLSLSLKHNHLTAIKQENFHGLNSLQFLDLSDNKIAQIDTNSFTSLRELVNFEISNNPLNGTLQEGIFDGLNSLPSLDISCTLLSTVQNGSLTGMIQMKNLNMSHSKINTLEYNIFVYTGAIESIDLSFNDLEIFHINDTELGILTSLYLNNNLLKTLDTETFQNLSQLSHVDLSFNMIQHIDANIFVNKKQLRWLDISYNANLNFTLTFMNNTKNVDVLNLSGIKTSISFGHLKDVSLSDLTMSNSSVYDVNILQLNELQRLDTLTLTYNNIFKLEAGGFYNISSLKNLDISYNKISFIQPGTFRDNVMLHTLNVSHNSLTAISYGIFRGLIFLQNLDISYNNIIDLQNERFYEVKSLSVLIADHNKIETIDSNVFEGTSLTQLSLGDNPIPCEVLVNFKRSPISFQVTAITLDEKNDENVDGVTCNKKLHKHDRIINVGTPTTSDHDKILLSIRDIMLEHFNNHQTATSTMNPIEKYLINITDLIKKSTAGISDKYSKFLNATAVVSAKNNETNILLDKILQGLKSNPATTPLPVQITKDNITYENLLSYIDNENFQNKINEKIKDALNIDKINILKEIEAKFSGVNSQANHVLIPTELPYHEKLTASADTRSLFTETCVALILVILVGFVLFKLYKSRVFVRQRFSTSTRELPEAIDSTL